MAAVQAGADALGLVFYDKSPRAVSVEQAKAIAAVVPGFVSLVGLFVDAGRDAVETTLQQVPLDLLQFHGNETASDCEGFGRRYIKALRVQPDSDLKALIADYPSASGILFDSFEPGVPGGTGNTFDWRKLADISETPFILAGGLNPENVAEAIRAVHPYAVDVSSGVEQAKGIKDAAKIAAFVQGVRSADEQ